jgi:acyl-CoA thioester hydrolase
MARSDFRFAHSLRVRWSEADMQGVVFNGHYLGYFDIGVTEYLRELCGGDAERLKDAFERMYVVKSTLEYRSPARFDDVIDLCVRTARIGGSSLRVLLEIWRDDDLLIEGENVYVFAEEGRSQRVPDALRALVRAFELTRPEE